MLDKMKCLAYPTLRVDRPGNSCGCISCDAYRKGQAPPPEGGKIQTQGQLEKHYPETLAYLREQFGDPPWEQGSLQVALLGHIVGDIILLGCPDSLVRDIARRIVESIKGTGQ